MSSTPFRTPPASSRATGVRSVSLTTIAGSVFIMIACLLMGSAEAQSDPIGPLTTDNAQSACVQFGDCTALPPGNTAVTRSQLSAVTSPATTENPFAAPTDAAQSQASDAALASDGASSAFVATATGSPTFQDYSSTSSFTGTAQVTSISFDSSSGTSVLENAARRTKQVLGSGTGVWMAMLATAAAVGLSAGVVILA